ncbi:MAG: helix-turn-helix transcriptional regulator, partial [Bradyrhizobium sp.]|nr:helix-turn-helix transcriptional regulator [Bradyrhizobium sp.]
MVTRHRSSAKIQAVIDPSELYDTRFYREWAEPQGLIDFVSASIEKRGDWAAMFGVFRHQRDGVANAETKVRMSLLVPHIRRAFLIGKVIEQRSFEAASLGDAFDGLAAGMFVIDAAGILVHANAAGHELLRRGGPLELKDDRIVAANRDDVGPLNAIVAAGGGSAAVRDANGDSFAAHLLPLTSGARRTTGVRYSAVAALFVHCVDIDLPAAPEIIARTYSLTLSELRVLLAIVEVGGVPETAQALGVAETTVKTHLHHVFTKTGMSRQADL